MSLYLTGTWEHALLAKVVSQAARIAQKEGYFLGRTAIQKIVYFLQVLDVPMRYRFEVYHYGPFCASILGDLEWLLADGAIADDSTDPKKYSKYTPGSVCEELIAKHAAKFEKYEETLKSTVKALLPLNPDHLELVATLDYAFRELKATARKKPVRQNVIARFREFKGAKFTDEDIAKTYDQLEAAGLFD
jgi:uncharacterized protein YwgA